MGDTARPKRPRPSPKVILRGHTSAVTSLAFLPTVTEPSRHLLTGDEKGTVRLWDTQFEETLLVHTLPKSLSSTPVQSFGVHPTSSNTVLVHYKSGHVARLDLSFNPFAADLEAWSASRRAVTISGAPSSSTDVKPTGAALNDSFCGVVFMSARVWAGPGVDSDALLICDERTGNRCVGILRPQADAKTGMLMALARGGEEVLVGGYEDGSVGVWDTRNAEREMRRVRVAKDAVLAVAASPFGRAAVAGGGFDEMVGVADLEGELQVVERVKLRADGISDVAWRQDGKLIASAGWDGVVRIWNGRRRPGSVLRRKGEFEWHDGSVQCVTYSSDGVLLASGGKDRTVALWDGI